MPRESAMAKATAFVHEQTAIVSAQVRELQDELDSTKQQLNQMQTKLQDANEAVLEAIDLLKEELAEDF